MMAKTFEELTPVQQAQLVGLFDDAVYYQMGLHSRINGIETILHGVTAAPTQKFDAVFGMVDELAVGLETSYDLTRKMVSERVTELLAGVKEQPITIGRFTLVDPTEYFKQQDETPLGQALDGLGDEVWP